jgi:hypothetical protein
MTRPLLSLVVLLLVAGCKEAPVNQQSSSAGQSTLAGTWQGVQSLDPNGGQGSFARMYLDDAPGGRVTGALQVSYGMDAADLGTIGHLSGPAQGGTFARGHFLPDGGIQTQITMRVTATQSLNHIDMVEQQVTLDGGSLPVYYRFDRQ